MFLILKQEKYISRLLNWLLDSAELICFIIVTGVGETVNQLQLIYNW